jgi:hypothetical protein
VEGEPPSLPRHRRAREGVQERRARKDRAEAGGGRPRVRPVVGAEGQAGGHQGHGGVRFVEVFYGPGGSERFRGEASHAVLGAVARYRVEAGPEGEP